MPHIPLPNFKTAFKVSQYSLLNLKQLTPTDKLVLARARIWGNGLQTNLRTSVKHIKKPWKGELLASWGQTAMKEEWCEIPILKDQEKNLYDEMKSERNKTKGQRILTLHKVKITERSKWKQKQYKESFERIKASLENKDKQQPAEPEKKKK